MKIDRFTKGVLVLIALGLWFNGIVALVRPAIASADTDATLNQIAQDVHKLSICVFGFQVHVHNE